MKTKTWTIRRHIVETYSVDAKSRKEALRIVAERGDPSTVEITKETCVAAKED